MQRDTSLLFSLWWVFPFIPVGIWVAQITLTRISPAAFEWIIIVLLIFSSLWLVATLKRVAKPLNLVGGTWQPGSHSYVIFVRQ